MHEVHGPLLVESGRKLTQLPPQNRRRDLNYVSPNKQRSSVTFPCDFDHRAMPFEHARRSVIRVLTMKKPFGATHCLNILSMAKSWPTCEALRRSASAMFVAPVVRRKLMVAFRNAAITWGPERLRIRLESSLIVTSRT